MTRRQGGLSVPMEGRGVGLGHVKETSVVGVRTVGNGIIFATVFLLFLFLLSPLFLPPLRFPSCRRGTLLGFIMGTGDTHRTADERTGGTFEKKNMRRFSADAAA